MMPVNKGLMPRWHPENEVCLEGKVFPHFRLPFKPPCLGETSLGHPNDSAPLSGLFISFTALHTLKSFHVMVVHSFISLFIGCLPVSQLKLSLGEARGSVLVALCTQCLAARPVPTELSPAVFSASNYPQ